MVKRPCNLLDDADIHLTCRGNIRQIISNELLSLEQSTLQRVIPYELTSDSHWSFMRRSSVVHSV
eukprot:6157160-Amphidinium_carterae.1